MKALFTAFPAYGHLLPMLPLARAAAAAGDETVALFTSTRADMAFDELCELVTDELPDVIVAEMWDYVAPLVARRLGIPWVSFAHSPTTPAEAAVSLLSPDGPGGFPTEHLPVTAERYGSVAHTYVVCTQDRVIPEALQRRFVREIDAVSPKPTRVVEPESSHSPFLSRPAELAGIIAAAA